MEQLTHVSHLIAIDCTDAVWTYLNSEALDVTPAVPNLGLGFHLLMDYFASEYRISFGSGSQGRGFVRQFGDAQRLKSVITKRRITAADIAEIPAAYGHSDKRIRKSAEAAFALLINGDLICGGPDRCLFVYLGE